MNDPYTKESITREHFLEKGYVVVQNLFSWAEITGLVQLFDCSRRQGWPGTGRGYSGQETHPNPLISMPQLHNYIHSISVTGLLSTLLGSPVNVKEVSLRYMPPREDVVGLTLWHRDTPTTRRGWDWPLIQVMLFLSDVTTATHSFAIKPENNFGDQYEPVEINGPTGTCVIFDTSVEHTILLKQSGKERKTLQAYYGPYGKHMSSMYTVAPQCFWNNSDPDVANFYRDLKREE